MIVLDAVLKVTNTKFSDFSSFGYFGLINLETVVTQKLQSNVMLFSKEN